MAPIKIKRGLDIPIHGRAEPGPMHDRLSINLVASLPNEAKGIKVKVLAEEGAPVAVGTPLYCDRRDEEVLFTAPAAGVLKRIVRGARRVPLAFEIEVSGFEDRVQFGRLNPLEASPSAVRSLLLKSGLWPSLRRRPFDSVARTTDTPIGIVVTAADTRPLAVSPLLALQGREAHFQAGLQVLRKLTEGRVFLCVRAGEDWGRFTAEGVQLERVEGPHPAGNAGTAIHLLCPVGAGRVAWHLGAQDVADIGQLFLTGQLPTTRVVAITGPAAAGPKLVRTRRGASLRELLAGEAAAAVPRFVDGSALDGRTAVPGEASGFLGAHSNQVTILEDDTQRILLGWVSPIVGRYSLTNTVLDKFFRRRFQFDTDTNGSLRAVVPIGVYERVMPLDILATQLVKALASNDLETAEKLGVLELAEEDLALCEFVDPCKLPLAELLRDMLTRIDKES
jgi:Na+-transporting NADH:ubiquinone oxidoreductase subunit A